MAMTTLTALVDGSPTAPWPLDDRGLAYGDGLFETLRFVAGKAPLWAGHMARLRRGCRVLDLEAPDVDRLAAEAGRLAGDSDSLVKIVLSRRGGRGYGSHGQRGTRRLLQTLPLPDLAPARYRQGLRLRWCRLRLSAQPALAGLKHLNRLEQVLARAEWADPDIDEGLLCDQDGRVVGATSANLFVVHRGQLITPALDACGVAGVARAWLLRRAARWLPVRQLSLAPRQVESADEVFLCNAVRGVMPVRALARRRFAIGPVTRRLAAALAATGIGEVLEDPRADCRSTR